MVHGHFEGVLTVSRSTTRGRLRTGPEPSTLTQYRYENSCLTHGIPDLRQPLAASALYLGLIVAQGVYVYKFLVELIHLVADASSMTETQIMLIVLGLIDVVMIANLLIMVVVGGYGPSSPRSTA